MYRSCQHDVGTAKQIGMNGTIQNGHLALTIARLMMMVGTMEVRTLSDHCIYSL